MARLREIKAAITAYREQIRKQMAARKGASSAEVVILKYLDRYDNHLFGHPAKYDEGGKLLSVVERTNNVAEHFFGADKQRLRRRLGRAHLGRDLEDQPAQVALTANLRHAEYVRVVCGSLEHLPCAFAELALEELQKASPLQRDNKDTRLLKRIRALLKDERSQQENREIGR
ncbi:MAG: hypothetical protein GY792_12960 [Gammaproteobacteria bacterium]|nr:hypothetical protein [Gammaproteobacteria bacterium]